MDSWREHYPGLSDTISYGPSASLFPPDTNDFGDCLDVVPGWPEGRFALPTPLKTRLENCSLASEFSTPTR
jgi:hypothetical protein